MLASLLAAAALRAAVLAGAGDALADWLQTAQAGTAEAVAVAVETPVPAEDESPEAEAPEAAPGGDRVSLHVRAMAEEAVSAGEQQGKAALAAVPVLAPAETVEVHDRSGLAVDIPALLAEELTLRLPAEGPQVLILHTHSSEAYTPDGYDQYEPSDPYRTEDKSQSVIRVGDALARVLEEAGLTVLHDRTIYDYPSYTGSYSRSGAAAERALAEHPSLRVVIDLHRDAIGEGDVVYRTRATLDALPCAQVMLLAGTGANGLWHPNWRENVKLALLLQRAAQAACPGLMRPLELVAERYNQQLSPGSLLIEVGSTGNTLQEAIRAAEHFGRAVGPVLMALVE